MPPLANLATALPRASTNSHHTASLTANRTANPHMVRQVRITLVGNMEGPLRLVDSSQDTRVSRHIRPEASISSSSSSSITGAVMGAIHTSTVPAHILLVG